MTKVIVIGTEVGELEEGGDLERDIGVVEEGGEFLCGGGCGGERRRDGGEGSNSILDSSGRS